MKMIRCSSKSIRHEGNTQIKQQPNRKITRKPSQTYSSIAIRTAPRTVEYIPEYMTYPRQFSFLEDRSRYYLNYLLGIPPLFNREKRLPNPITYKSLKPILLRTKAKFFIFEAKSIRFGNHTGGTLSGLLGKRVYRSWQSLVVAIVLFTLTKDTIANQRRVNSVHKCIVRGEAPRTYK